MLNVLVHISFKFIVLSQGDMCINRMFSFNRSEVFIHISFLESKETKVELEALCHKLKS